MSKFEGKYSDAIGIDLGTTNCVVSILDSDGNPHNIPDEEGKEIIPSFIYFYEDEENNKIKYLVGNRAKAMMSEDPNNVVSSYKTYMGIKDTKTGKSPIIKTIKGKSLTAETCSTLMLAYLKDLAESYTGNKINKAVITVPAYFSEAQKSATMQSAKNAGLEVLKLINEPTAAAYYYNKELNKGENSKVVLAYDLGGGTFDLSLLNLERDENGIDTTSNVIDVSGDAKLGGDDIDRAIASFMNDCSLNSLLQNEESEKIIREAEDCKKYLTTEYFGGKKTVTYKPKNKELKQVTMKEFLNILEPFINRTMELTKAIVEDSNLKDDINDILLIGGSTRLPLIREKLIEYFDGRFDIKYFEDYIVAPDFAVAYGARVVMKNIIDNEDVQVSDVVSIPIHINTTEGLKTILDKGHPIPSTVRYTFYNTEDNQSFIDVNIYEGFGINADSPENTIIGTISIPVTPSPKGTIPVLTKMTINKDSLLSIEVRANGKREVLHIKRHFEDGVESVSTVLEQMSGKLNIDKDKLKSVKF